MTIRRDRSRSPSATLRSGAKLGGYFAASIGAAVLGTAESEAAVVTLNLGGFGILGPNAGVQAGGYKSVSNFPFVGGPKLYLYNGYSTGWYGVGGFRQSSTNQLGFAASSTFATPAKIGPNTLIDGSLSFETDTAPPLFRYDSSLVSPDWGDNSYLAFRVVSGTDSYFGYLKATWSQSTNTFQLLSGAYESTPNTAIRTPAVPEPSTIALTGIGALALGGGAIRRSRKARKESLANAV